MARTRHLKRAREAVVGFLRANARQPTLPLFEVTVIADQAARDAGRKGELFASLYAYQAVLPPGAEIGWQAEGAGELLMVTNPSAATLEAPRLAVSPSVPGVFDTAVDMGPDVIGGELKRTQQQEATSAGTPTRLETASRKHKPGS